MAQISAMTVTRLVFFNPAAGSAWSQRATRRAIERLTAVTGTAVHTTQPGSVAAQVREHLTADITRVYAVGGDGTVGDVATALVDSPAALAIIPCGTTNVLAREYGIPLRAGRAVACLEASDRTALLRTWQANGHTAVLGAGVGWDARVMSKSPQAMKRRTGRLGVAMVGFGEIARYEFPPLVVRGVGARGEPAELRGSSVILATVKRWAGGNVGIPQADPGDDLIDVVVLQPRSRLHLLTFWTLMTTRGGRPLMLPGVRWTPMRRARVECEDGRPIEVHVNGEAVSHTPFSMEPGGIVRVVMP